jgi:hypothetical protein
MIHIKQDLINMATIGGANIVRDGAILIIDPGSSRCFTGGNTCVNLVTDGLLTGANGTPGAGVHTPNAANFPAYNSINAGVFDFSGGRGMNVEEDLGTASSASICMWIYKNSSSVAYFTDARNNGGNYFLTNYSTLSSNITHTGNALKYNFEEPYNPSAPDFLNKWMYIVAISSSSNSALYINGVEQAAFATSSFNENFGINFRIGCRFTTSAEWTGYMGPIQLYNKRLTADEIYQNFSAHRTRFDI